MHRECRCFHNLGVIPVQSLLEGGGCQGAALHSVELAEEVIYESKLELVCETVNELGGHHQKRTARTGQAMAG